LGIEGVVTTGVPVIENGVCSKEAYGQILRRIR